MTHNLGNRFILTQTHIINFIAIILPFIIDLMRHANIYQGCSCFEFTITFFTRLHKEKTGNCSVIRFRWWRWCNQTIILIIEFKVGVGIKKKSLRFFLPFWLKCFPKKLKKINRTNVCKYWSYHLPNILEAICETYIIIIIDLL